LLPLSLMRAWLLFVLGLRSKATFLAVVAAAAANHVAGRETCGSTGIAAAAAIMGDQHINPGISYATAAAPVVVCFACCTQCMTGQDRPNRI
jgi:hypothetical protein